MKQSQVLAMKARQRSERQERFGGYKTTDIANMNTEELTDYVAWLDYELPRESGARYAHLSLLDDMAREELAFR
jgi:hypothetical protein